ncbi:MAG: hypothetical protein IJT95_01480 [Abditibacteriota bacterium]|nr:hypothetical protein [Abditibacteriota bacterium]
MLKLRGAGLNIALDMLHREFFLERFEGFACDFAGKPDFLCVSRTVDAIPVPEGRQTEAGPRKRVIETPEGTMFLGLNRRGETVFGWYLSRDASEMRLYFLEGYTYRRLTRTALEYKYSCSGFSDRAALAGRPVLHGAAISYRGRGIVFSARPGVGKSTQASLWQSLWPEDTARINEDRPAVSFRGDDAFLEGIPWSGTEPVNLNVTVPFGALIMLRRGPEPGMRRLAPREVLRPIYEELCVSHGNRQAAEKIYDLLGQLLERVPAYMLDCTMGPETPLLAMERLTKDGIL